MTATLDWSVTSCVYGFGHPSVTLCLDVYLHAYVATKKENELESVSFLVPEECREKMRMDSPGLSPSLFDFRMEIHAKVFLDPWNTVG